MKGNAGQRFFDLRWAHRKKDDIRFCSYLRVRSTLDPCETLRDLPGDSLGTMRNQDRNILSCTLQPLDDRLRDVACSDKTYLHIDLLNSKIPLTPAWLPILACICDACRMRADGAARDPAFVITARGLLLFPAAGSRARFDRRPGAGTGVSITCRRWSRRSWCWPGKALREPWRRPPRHPSGSH